MIIGVPTEIKTREFRVGINPGGVAALTRAGHQVHIQKGAGLGSGITDAEFTSVGAKIVPTAADAWAAEMVMKVKEPLASEVQYFREGQILYTYLHLAPLPELTRQLMEKKVRAIAYETVENPDGSLPLLRPMSEVAGRMATQVGATSLEKERGGRGILLGGVPGTRRGHVTILGGGIVGSHAARIAVGLGAQVTMLEVNHDRMAYLEDIFQGQIETLYSDPKNVEESVCDADLVIGAVLVAGAKAPKLVTEDLVKKMKPGAVVVDVAVDQGGCIETCKPTSHDNPTFVLHDVVHYCVPNMPGAVPMTSTFALTNVTARYALKIANEGVEAAVRSDAPLAKGVNTWDGACTYEAVANDVGVEYTPLASVLG
ncbi:MAG: alanine dehydrogenase [Myxococcota bacterium]|nr:alanine dehydrogenase [Myxococcota bacterium]